MHYGVDTFLFQSRKEDISIKLFKVIMKEFRVFTSAVVRVADNSYLHYSSTSQDPPTPPSMLTTISFGSTGVYG